MATQTVQILAPTGLSSPTMRLFTVGTGTQVNSDQTASAVGTSGVLYSAAFTDAPAGRLRVELFSGSTVVAASEVVLTSETATFVCVDPVNVLQISGDATAADNLEAQYDTTGLTGDTFPATQAEIAALNDPTAAAIRAEIDANSTQLVSILTNIAALNNLDSTAVQNAANAALVALHLDHLLAVDYDPAAQPGTSTALLNELIENDAGVSRFTANALEQAPSGGGGGGDDAATIYSYFTTDPRQDAFKADLSETTITPADIAAIAAAVLAVSESIPTPPNASVIGPLTAGDVWTIDLTALGTLENRTNLIWMLKSRRDDPDSKAILWIDESTGLIRLRGSAYDTASDASITVLDQAAGDVRITVKNAATKYVDAGTLKDSLKMFRSAINGGDHTFRPIGETQILESTIDQST